MASKQLILLALLLISILTIKNTYSDNVTVRLNENYLISWTYLEEYKNITFETIVKTKGFIGIGFSTNGAMIGADIVIGGVAEDGKPYLYV